MKLEFQNENKNTLESRLKCKSNWWRANGCIDVNKNKKRKQLAFCLVLKTTNEHKVKKTLVSMVCEFVCLSCCLINLCIAFRAGLESQSVGSVSNFHVRRDCKNRFWISTNNTFYERTRTFTFHFNVPTNTTQPVRDSSVVCFKKKNLSQNRITPLKLTGFQRERFTKEGNAHKASFFLSFFFFGQKSISLVENANISKWNKLP